MYVQHTSAASHSSLLLDVSHEEKSRPHALSEEAAPLKVSKFLNGPILALGKQRINSPVGGVCCYRRQGKCDVVVEGMYSAQGSILSKTRPARKGTPYIILRTSLNIFPALPSTRLAVLVLLPPSTAWSRELEIFSTTRILDI